MTLKKKKTLKRKGKSIGELLMASRSRVKDLMRAFLVAFTLQVGDRIIEVDGVDLRHSTHERAVEVIQAAGNPVCLLVQSLVHLVRPRHDQEYRCTLPPPPVPSFSTVASHFPLTIDRSQSVRNRLSPQDHFLPLYRASSSICSSDGDNVRGWEKGGVARVARWWS